MLPDRNDSTLHRQSVRDLISRQTVGANAPVQTSLREFTDPDRHARQPRFREDRIDSGDNRHAIGNSRTLV